MIRFIKKLMHWLDGVVVTDDTVSLRQRVGWVHIPRQEILAVKWKRGGEVVIRLRAGDRIVVSMAKLNRWAHERAIHGLTDGLERIKEGREAWTYERTARRGAP